MQALAGITVLMLCVCSGVLGFRLLRLWRRTRRLPELSVALMLLLVTALGYPLMIASRAESALGFAVAWPLFVLASLSINLGFVALYVFTWRTFRPAARWAPLLVVVAALSYTASLVANALHMREMGTLAVAPAVSTWRLLASILATDGAYAWTGIEAFLTYARLRRQRRLGLVDPAVCNRVLLWGWLSVVIVAVLVNSNRATLSGVDVLTSPSILLMTSLAGIAQVVFLLLIFLPPRAYLAWLRRDRAGADAARAAE